MFRICADAPARIARDSSGYRVLTALCSATAVFRAAAPIRRLPSSRSVMPLYETRDIDESGGLFESLTHQVDEIRTAAQILRSSLAAVPDSIRNVRQRAHR